MVKNLLLMTALVAGVANVAEGTIQWPVGPAGTGSQTRTLFTCFGDFNPPWNTVGTDSCNFHIGVDILPYNGNSDVRAAKDGYFKEIVGVQVQPGEYEWWVVIVDDYDKSTHGWGYQHLTNPFAHGWTVGPEEPPISQNSLIATMSPIPQLQHLHFHWVPKNGGTLGGSEVNPLDFLMNADSLIWEWNRGDWYDVLLFIPDMPIQSWPDNSSNLDTLDRNSLYGSIDILYGYCLDALGAVGNPGQAWHVTPQKIEWTLSRLTQSGPVNQFDRYVVNFSGLLGRYPQDNTRYQQHFFRLSDYQKAGISAAPAGRIICLTNAGDATGYDGINNIEENSWQTNQHISGSGTAQASELARYRDGLYQIQVTSYAHDNSSHQVSESVTVDNFPPNVVEAFVYRKGPENDVSNTLPPIIGHWQWVIEEERTLSRTLQDITIGSTFYLSEDEEDRLGVVLVFSEQMEELPELWITGEWPGGSWDSRTEGSGAVFNACAWDASLTPPSPSNSHLLQCFETSAGITGYHGTLRLNIAGGEDMSGNALDADPGTVAAPRDPQGFGDGYEQGVDSSYIWPNARPEYTREDYGSYLVTGSSYGIGEVFEVVLDEEMVRYEFISSQGFTGGLFHGKSPYWHGFWMGIVVDSSILQHFYRVRILDFEGQVVKNMTIRYSLSC